MTNPFLNDKTFIEAMDALLLQDYKTNIRSSTAKELYACLTSLVKKEIQKNQQVQSESTEVPRKCIYFSMEFLMGKMLKSNLKNMHLFDLIKKAFNDNNISLTDVLDVEEDAGLGNGGLGRLAACFLDSSASLGLPVYGNSIRYKHGYFVQQISNCRQVELYDHWLEEGYAWETKKEEDAVEIPFFGRIVDHKYVDQVWVKAVPYDIDIVGDNNNVVNRLRIWEATPSDKVLVKDEMYLREVEQITDVLYPDDSADYGKMLRVKQQYLFCAAGISNVFKDLKANNISVYDLPKYYVFQINDTHPTLIIPELLRTLIDEYKISYDEAWGIITKTVAYTNHTILHEALEKWSIDIISTLLPRIWELIQEIDRRFKNELDKNNKLTFDQKIGMSIINGNMVHMANLAVHGCFSVNGVAKLHTEILKNDVMANFYKIYKNKFNNKTNGVTHRRFLLNTNDNLVRLIDEKLGPNWKKNIDNLEKLTEFREDEQFLNRLRLVKRSQKILLVNKIKKELKITINVDSIFDIQVKRLHEYKRQILNIMHIIYLYLRLRSDEEFKKNYYPHTFIFGAKAAPSYYIAKKTIELINAVAARINNDERIGDLIKIVFIPNFNVSWSERIVTAADVSEQISTAGKEASGTGNMKFMMNGAVTIGTLDGANVEIHGLVGDDNCYIFGLKADEAINLAKSRTYKPYNYYLNDINIKKVIDYFSHVTTDEKGFDDLKNNLLNSDYYLVLRDFESYRYAHEFINEAYKDQISWQTKALENIAKSCYFSSDRTIKEYNKDIWNLKKYK